jgi:phage terminase large subunit
VCYSDLPAVKRGRGRPPGTSSKKTLSPPGPFDYRIRQYPWLREAFECLDPSLLLVGPWASGKTRFLGEKAYFLAATYPGLKAALVRKHQKHLRRTTWKSLLEVVIPPNVLSKCRLNKTELELQLPNGSQIIGCGLDDNQKLASLEFAFIGLEEAIEITSELDYAWLESRCRQPGMPTHQTCYVTNAGNPSHYLYQNYYIKKPPGNKLIEGQVLWDLLPASYKVRLNLLKGRYKQRFIENKWIGFEGVVYDNFSPPSQVIPRFEIPEDWEYVLGCDLGYSTGFVFQLWAISPDEDYYLDKELYASHKTINALSTDLVALMEERNLIRGPKNQITKDQNGKDIIKLRSYEFYSDHDAEDRATLDEYNLISAPADKSVSPGIQHLYDLMGDNRIFLFEDASVDRDPYLESQGKPCSLLEEIQQYAWKDNAKKDEVRKENDHACDCARYAIFSRHQQHAAPGGVFFAGPGVPTYGEALHKFLTGR